MKRCEIRIRSPTDENPDFTLGLQSSFAGVGGTGIRVSLGNFRSHDHAGSNPVIRTKTLVIGGSLCQAFASRVAIVQPFALYAFDGRFASITVCHLSRIPAKIEL